MVLWALSGFIFWKVLQRVLSPLKKLQHAINCFKEKSPMPKLEIGGLDELSQLSRDYLEIIHACEDTLARQRVLETMRRDFIANVSHELKTPLTTIAGFIETLESGALEDAQHNRRFLGIISTNVKRLTLLVQDILNLAKIENEISPRETVNLVDLVRTMLQEHFSAHLTRITFSPSQKPITVLANLREIYSACLNYVDNAIKYAPYGPIDISLTKDAGSIYYRVKDGGPGISPNELSRIFERFYRPDKNRSRETGGTGLGLSIVKNVVEKHGGAVGVESVEGQGTLFYFRLPLQS